MNKDSLLLKGIELYSAKISSRLYDTYKRNLSDITSYYDFLPSEPLTADLNVIWDIIADKEKLDAKEKLELQKISSAGMILTVLDSYAIRSIGSTDLRMLLYLTVKIIRTVNELKKAAGGGSDNSNIKVELTKAGGFPLNTGDAIPQQDDLIALPACLVAMLEIYLKIHTDVLSGSDMAVLLEKVLSGKFSATTLAMALIFLSKSEDTIMDYDFEFEKFIAEKSVLPEFTI